MTRRVITNFKAANFVSGGEAEKPKKAAKPKPAAPAADTVPVGTTAEVLKWVGDDKDKAREAKSVELESDSPRKSVLGALDSILGDTEDDSEKNKKDDKDTK